MGLSKLDITESEVNTAISSATTLTRLLGDSNAKAKSLLSKVQGSKWDGEAKDSFIAYLSIVQKYHSDMHKASKKQTKALKTIPTGISGYESHGEVSKVKSL
ncbi:hypothetical protein IGL98_003465 [Enterococcus sp. DIV0840]|uniref:hypothetical protein n=1 Tax=unclassified Enterococcus TaxID=2608891 RepID=UPI000A337049|nr:hypothetical protein [Enterococcus sp. DIV0849a]MBO0436167.1 hypothetical protein [Enterococcus sp. DIV0849a]OTP50280.1 hypothetical protein A5881_001704 [Enterococcus termitis]